MTEFLEWFAEYFHFRNTGHALWFLDSIFIFGLCTIFYLLTKRRIFFLFGLWHLPISAMAVIQVLILQRPSEAFSTDCIWFNALMSGVYMGLYFLAHKREQKRTGDIQSSANN